ncbi:protein sidekick-2-like [Anneissia japonica]|uniref:protein sidekick-2-like n=1 Tax=Anneissia japonica TaxID=1529436 RepID=UPI001425623D|nr:protein sidekick-2-like [Anneissia japonica]
MCPTYVNKYKCEVPVSDGDGNLVNPGVRHQVRVIVQNYLGKATTQQYFWPDGEAVPLPPIVETTNTSQTTLTIRFGLQEELGNYAKSSLRYHVRYSSSDSPNHWIKDSDLNNRDEQLTISGLEYYTMYDLQARAKFSGGSWSEWGPVASARTDEGAPEGAVNFTVQEINDKFTRDILLRWTRFPEKDLNGQLLGYRVALWGSDSESKISEYQVDADTTIYTISDQTQYEQFYVSVVAYSSFGETRHDKVQILDKSKKPGKPTGLDGEVLSWNSVNISWGIPDEPGSLTLLYYIEWRDNSQTKSGTVFSNAQEEPMVSYLVTDLEAYTEYTFQVRAQNGDGNGQYSEAIKRTTFESVPGNVSMLSVNAVEENSTLLSVSWSAPEQTNGVITKYKIYYHQYPNGFIHNEFLTPEQEIPYLLGSLTPHEKYVVWMTASNKAGEGAVSQKINQTTSQGTPTAPQNVTVSKVTSTGFTVHWDAPEQTNGIIKHYSVKVNDTDHSERFVKSTEIEIDNLFGYTRYVVSVAACTEGHANHACGEESSPESFIQTLIGVPGPPSNLHSESKSSKSFTMLWSPPGTPNGPIEHYSVVYRHQNMVNETYQVKDTKFGIDVSCTGTETLKYTFSVKAVNKDENNSLLPGPEVGGDYEFMCDAVQDPTIILYILVPSVIVLMFVLITCIYKSKYHDKYFTKWPEPKIIQVVINPELSPRPIEKEKFDPLKKRPHSQSSHGSTASSDQGFHEMSLSHSQVELNTQEQKVHFVLNRSNIRSDSLTDELEDETFYPQEQNPRIETENTCDNVSTCSDKKGKEYFHMNYKYMMEDEIQYQRLVLKGSQEALDFTPSNDLVIQKQSSESSEEVIDIDESTTDIDPYIKMIPTSPTSQTSIQLTADEAKKSEHFAHISSDIKSEDDRNVESVIDIGSTGIKVQNEESHQTPNEAFLSGDYVQSSNFRVLHQMSEESVDDGIDDSSGSAINDYSQVNMPNLSDFLENLGGTV